MEDEWWGTIWFIESGRHSPVVRQMLENGALAIPGTKRDFLRTAIDIIVEQTMKADVASHQTEISAFTTSEKTKIIWVVTRTTKGAIVGALLLKASLKNTEYTTKELKHYWVKKDNKDQHKYAQNDMGIHSKNQRNKPMLHATLWNNTDKQTPVNEPHRSNEEKRLTLQSLHNTTGKTGLVPRQWFMYDGLV